MRLIAFGTALVLGTLNLHAQETVLGGPIDAAQEVPANASPGTGTISCVIDTAANTLTYHVAFQNLSAPETAAHIHGPAAPGANAGVKFNLGTGNPKIGVWNYPQSDEADLLAGLMYVNIHSSAFPGGEIRGQLLVDGCSTTVLSGPIDAAQEVPANGSPGTGRLAMFIDTTANRLSYYVEFQNLTTPQTAAHIHGPALPGANAGVKHNIGTGNPKTGTWVYPQADEADILAGRMYVNIHSSMFGGGEIRGQIVTLENPDVYCTAKVNSQGCIPQISGSGSPSLTGADDFFLNCSMKINNKPGLFFFGFGPASIPFFNGTLCVQPPLARTGVQFSGGNPPPDDCSGTYSFHFDQALMSSFSLSAGDLVYGQFWSRDSAQPDGTGISLSDGALITIKP